MAVLPCRKGKQKACWSPAAFPVRGAHTRLPAARSRSTPPPYTQTPPAAADPGGCTCWTAHTRCRRPRRAGPCSKACQGSPRAQGHQGGSTSLLPAPLSVPARPTGVIRAAATHLWPPSSTTCLPPAALSACMPSPLFKVRTVQRFEPPQIAAVRSHYLLGAGLLEGGAHPHRAASGPGGGAPLGGGGGSAHGNHGGQAEGDRQEMLQRRLGAQESGLK